MPLCIHAENVFITLCAVSWSIFNRLGCLVRFQHRLAPERRVLQRVMLGSVGLFCEQQQDALLSLVFDEALSAKRVTLAFSYSVFQPHTSMFLSSFPFMHYAETSHQTYAVLTWLTGSVTKRCVWIISDEKAGDALIRCTTWTKKGCSRIKTFVWCLNKNCRQPKIWVPPHKLVPR